jgi:hypothetical protein
LDQLMGTAREGKHFAFVRFVLNQHLINCF